MRYEDTEFDPATDADREAAAREAELARKIRREVLRVQRGEADDDLRADREAEQEQQRDQQRGRPENTRRAMALCPIVRLRGAMRSDFFPHFSHGNSIL